jgi:prevent-host-death family protein
MRRVPATEFKAKCLELMDRVAERRETYLITKRGRPVARLMPPVNEPKDTMFGWLRGKATIAGDLREPVVPAGAWEVVTEWDELNSTEAPAKKAGARKPGRPRRSRR